MATAAVEFNKQSELSIPSKSSRPHVSMDMVPLIDPSSEKHNEVKVKCSHFSIRGYVSEVRKKDPRLCYPFSQEDSNKPLYNELPPMEVPKFRWWQCIGCVPEASVSYGAAGNKEAQKSDKNADGSLALVEEFSKTNVRRERIGEASTSTDSNDNRNGRKNVDSDLKGKGKAHVDVEPIPLSAYNNGFLKDSTQGFLQQPTEKIEVSPSVGNQVIELGSKCHENGISRALEKDSRECQIEPRLAQDSVYHDGERPENSQSFPHDRLADSRTNMVRTEVVGLVSGPRNDCRSRLLNLPDLNECSGEPLYDENIEAMINNDSNNNDNDVDCEDDDDYLGAECRKNPKVRLLSELLGIKETLSVKGKKKNPSLTSSLDENGKRKRVLSLEEGSRSIEIRVSDSGIKKLSRTTESSETVSDYESDSDDKSTEVISKALAKRRCKSRIPLIEKKNKKAKVDHGGSSICRQKIVSKSAAHEKGKTTENIPPKNDVADKLIERSLVMTKKRGKLFQPGKEGNSLTPCKNRVPKDFAATQKDENAEKRSTQKFQKASENDVLFPRSLVNCQACVSPEEDGPRLASSQVAQMLVDGNSAINHRENINKGGEASLALRATAVGTPSTSDSFDANGGLRFDPKTDMKGKKAGIFEIEEGNPLARDTCVQASNSVANQKEQTREVRGRIHDIDINSIPIDDKVTDDIPMDIVELMAKNQYERHLSDPKETPYYPATPEISRKYIRNNGINGSYGEYWQKFGQPPFPTMPRPPSNTDSRTSMVHGNLGYYSEFNRHSLSVASCYPRENTISARFLTSNNQTQEHSPPYPPCGLTLSNWNGTVNMAPPQRYPPSFLHTAEPYRVRACAPRQNTTEPSRVWPSVVASPMPLGITNPQMISRSSSVLSKGKIGHRESSGGILTFSNPGPTSLGKQQNLNFSNGCSNVGRHPESSGSSVDMHSNDAVSAMHLLSLMQNAARMQNAAALSLGPPQKVVGPTNSRQFFIEDKGRSCSASSIQENARHPCYPTAIPTVRPFVPSFQTDGGNVGRRNSNNNGFVGPIPLTLRGQRNMDNSHFGLPGRDHHPQRRQMGSSLDNTKDFSAISPPSYVNPLQGSKDPAPNFFSGRGVRREERTISPAPETMICKLNQNPSEFNDLKELSRYMIGPDDLRPRKPPREKSVRPRGDAKRQELKLNKHKLPGKEREKQRKF